MPGSPGHWSIAAIDQWARDTIKQRSLTDEQQSEKFADQNEARAKLLAAQADKERALANMARRQDSLEEGSYTPIDDLNLFMGEFFTEFRQLLNRMVVDMSAGYGKDLRPALRQDLQSRVDLTLQQMHDWTLRTEDLEIKPKSRAISAK